MQVQGWVRLLACVRVQERACALRSGASQTASHVLGVGGEQDSSPIEKSHRDPVYDVAWLQVHMFDHCLTVATTGQHNAAMRARKAWRVRAGLDLCLVSTAGLDLCSVSTAGLTGLVFDRRSVSLD